MLNLIFKIIYSCLLGSI